MSGHKCHCGKPATWFVRAVPYREVVLVEGHLPELVLAAMAEDTWACCDKHLGEAATGMAERNDAERFMLLIRPEGE